MVSRRAAPPLMPMDDNIIALGGYADSNEVCTYCGANPLAIARLPARIVLMAIFLRRVRRASRRCADEVASLNDSVKDGPIHNPVANPRDAS
jgi:hypothetical protein